MADNPIAPLPVEALRTQFPVLAQSIHGQPLAYLDNAATTQTPLAVQQAQLDFERQDRANIHRGVHTLSQRATDAFEAARATLHRFIGAGAAHELVFTSVPVLNPTGHGVGWLLGRTGFETDTVVDGNGRFREDWLALYLFRRQARRLA